MISLDGETLKIAEKIPNFSAWVRAQLIKTEEVKKLNEELNKKDYACTRCDKFLTTHHDLNYIMCGSRKLGELGNVECMGHFMEVV